jgi:hypothetical protein
VPEQAERRPARGSWGPLVWLAGIIGALLAGGVYLWSQDTRQGTSQPEYSIARTDHLGAAVAFRLFERAGLAPRVWNEPLTRLSAPGTLIMVAPARMARGNPLGLGSTEGDLLPDEIRALDEWVRRGNVAVVLARDPNDLYYALGLIVDEPNQETLGTPAPPAKAAAPQPPAAGQPQPKAATPLQPSVLARGVGGVETTAQFGYKFGRAAPAGPFGSEGLEPPTPLIEAVPADRWLPLFAKHDGSRVLPQVVTAARGQGLYVAVNDEFPASNLGITRGDNARFLLNLAALHPTGGTVWFDEFHKRSVDRGFVSYLKDRALLPALVYLMLLVLLVLWRAGVRFGAPLPLVPDRRRDSGEYVRAVAQLYRNAGMAHEALTIVFADFRRRLAGALRLDGLADLEEVGRRYEQRTGRPALEARRVLVETEATLARGKLTEAEALHAAARLTQLDAQLHARRAPARKGGPPPAAP